MKYEELKKIDESYILGTYGREELDIVKGKGATCYTDDNRRYIDFTSGIGVNSLGFCDDEWVEAVSKQAGTLQHISNLFYTEPCALLAEKLIQRTGLKKVFFANSGAEANEGVIKIARKYSSEKYTAARYEIITLNNSFHGRTMAAISATGQDNYHTYFNPMLDGFKHVDANNIEMLKNAINEKTCAIMLELIQGEGGVISLEEDFIIAVEEICREQDLLLIADEVQTGIGRTGKLMAYEHVKVKPDLVTIAKGLGSGLPIGAFLVGEKCEFALKQGDHGSTFGGNPVACAGGLVVMERIDETFLKEVMEKGEYFKKRLLEIKNVIEITGIGLMLGVTIEGKTAKEVVHYCTRNGLLVLTAKDKIRLLPPLVITKEEIDEGLMILEKAIVI